MSAKRNTLNKNAKKETARPHQPGQSAFAAILPEKVDWKPFPSFPPSARLASAVNTVAMKSGSLGERRSFEMLTFRPRAESDLRDAMKLITTGAGR
jgi:hypothetical protein